MDFLTPLLTSITTLLLSFAYFKYRFGTFQKLGAKIIETAELERKEKLKELKAALDDERKIARQELELEGAAFKKKIDKETASLAIQAEKCEQQKKELEKRSEELLAKEKNIKAAKELEAAYIQKLEKTANLTANEAALQLKEQAFEEITEEVATYLRKKREEAENCAEEMAKKHLINAMSRLSHLCTAESSVTTVALPSEDLKGRIIGKEGRNIRTLEKALGVSFVLDDTPLAVVISSFNPLRRQLAKIALSDLVLDGRIHPTRIEEAVEKAKTTLEKQIVQAGEDAAYRSRVYNLNPELCKILGKLKFRDSLGQNVLEHSIEVSHLMGLIADELGLDSQLARRIGLLHDIGKALTHEVEGTHALIGRDLVLKFGESELVANGVGCHHNEIEPQSFEGSLCSVADAISGSRPGARAESLSDYFKRLEKLEDLALQMPGVEKAYALQAGREIRVMVKPDFHQGDEMLLMARELTKKIEKELSYSGKIRVTLTSEKRVVDYAM